MEEENASSCKLCLRSAAKYTCPRCNVRYCSSECYRSKEHLECSELFYRNCFMEGLRSMDSADDEKYKMVEMLKRFEKENSVTGDESDDDCVPDLAERISGIDLDQHPEKVLDVLTPEEIKEFEALLKEGKSDIVELWNPWWCEDRPMFLEEVPSDSDSAFASIPPLLQGVEDIGKLLKTKMPSETIAFDIINTLFGYAYVARLYNGDHHSMSVESARSMVSLSLSLQQMQFSDVAMALGSCISCTAGNDQFVSSEYSIAVVRDVLRIVEGPSTLSPLLYVMSALSDSHRLFRTAYKILKGKRKKSAELQKQAHLFYAVQRKLEFYMSWVRAYGLALRELIPLVELELCTLSSELATIETEKGRIQVLLDEHRQSKKLIEEL